MGSTATIASIGGIKMGVLWAGSMAIAGLVGNVTSNLSDYKQLQQTVERHERWQIQHAADVRQWQREQAEADKEQRELMRQVSEGLARIEGQLEATKATAGR